MADGVLPSVDTLSDSDVDKPVKAKRAKTKGSKPKKSDCPVDSETHLRATLARKCSCKSKNCFAQFLADDDFTEFHNFWSNWASFHKLDQDKFVTGFDSDIFFLESQAAGDFATFRGLFVKCALCLWIAVLRLWTQFVSNWSRLQALGPFLAKRFA